jgi:uncharacterized OB-fold protein
MSVGPVQRDDATAEFFDGAAAGRFLLRQCPQGHLSEPSATACTTCGRAGLQWAAAAGGATLVSWAVSYSRAAPGEPRARTVLVIGELDEGPWWWAQLAGTDADDPAAGLAAGQRLRIEFRSPDGGLGAQLEPVPVFVLV